MTINELRAKNLIVLECISGSRSYGLELPGSDTDIKGVFVLPEEDYLGLNYTEQVSNESNDVVFYELKRFLELLLKNNPNIIELLGVPEECIIYRHPLLESLQPSIFLSKLCRETFANYALSQIKKAKGLNKKINKPMDEKRKTIIDFCFLTENHKSVSLSDWLHKKGLKQEQCGLSAIEHMRDMFALFVDETGEKGYRGIAETHQSNDVRVSTIEKNQKPDAYLFFNKDGYSVYCKEYKSYWEWVTNRNDLRYHGTMKHGKGYDAKNMMHVFRLLDMAQEIAEGKEIITKRPNRDYLLSIRSGEFEYEYLLSRAEQQMKQIQLLYDKSDLPKKPDPLVINQLLVRLRKTFYNGYGS